MDPIVPLQDLMGKEFPEQEWVVDQLVPASALTILSGAPASFKTWTLLHMALSIAEGKPVFGRFETEQGGVLIIDEESHQRLIQDRLRKLNATKDVPVYFTPHRGFKVEDELIDNVILSCRTYDIKLVIIDSLIRIHRSDENSSREMAEVFAQLGKFVDKDIAVLVTQHNRKMSINDHGLGQAMRGSSDILAAVDSHLAVTRKGKWDLTLTQTKQRFAEELDPFEVEVVSDDTGLSLTYRGTSQNKELLALKSAIYDVLSEGELNQKQILEQLKEAGTKIGQRKLSRILQGMCEEGELSSKPGDGNETLYFLPAKPSEV